MIDTVVDVTAAVKRFGATEALRGVDLELRRSEWLGLLGPNGAGKTTLVRSIAGRCRLDAGQIRLFGARVEAGGPEADDARRRLGVVPQEIALYPLLSGRENLEAFGRLSGLSGPTLRERTAWAIDFTGLEDRAGDLVRGYSGGMCRRLNIACGILHRPEVILLDEPTVGVDPQSRERIWEMLETLRGEGASLLLTTHQLDEAQRVCERIVIIDNGRRIAGGSVDELIAETVGGGRRVTLTMEKPVAELGIEAEIDGHSVRCFVEDVASALPELLRRVQQNGNGVRDVAIESPTLQSVFIHLTGRELRE